MFLRNIGFTQNLAVIDTHVLRYLAAVGQRCSPQRPGIASLRKYEIIESRLRRIAEEFGTDPGRLDTAIWVVMRLVPREPAWA
jgi:N-glycosylase/DNA lyase